MEKKINRERRFNMIKHNYIEALHAGSNKEELRSRLHSLILEAIKADISLKELLEILSGACIQGSEKDFKKTVSTRYGESKDSVEDTLKK